MINEQIGTRISCGVISLVFCLSIGNSLIITKSSVEAETLKMASEKQFVSEAVVNTIVDDTIYHASKDSAVSESGVLSKGIEDNIKEGAIAEAEQIKEEEERARLEEERARLEAERSNPNLTYNVFQKSNLSVEQFNEMLKGTALAGHGEAFYNMENTYNVNGVFAVAVACHESANGYRTANTHNYYGMRAAKGGWKSFSSADENIMYFGKYITGKMYNGKSIEGIGKIYCPNTWSSWASKVKAHMNEKYNKISL